MVVDAVAEHLRYVEESLASWDFSADRPERLAGYRPEKGLRQKLADFVHCDMEEIGLTANATMAMNLVANGLDLKAGDEVLITDKEHPGGRSGWDVRQKRHGVVVREVPVPTSGQGPGRDRARVRARAITPRTQGDRRAARHVRPRHHPAGQAPVRDGARAPHLHRSSTARRRSASCT